MGKLVFGKPIPQDMLPVKWVCEDCGEDERLALDICTVCGGNAVKEEES